MAGGGGVDPISANLTTGANISQIQTDTTDNTYHFELHDIELPHAQWGKLRITLT